MREEVLEVIKSNLVDDVCILSNSEISDLLDISMRSVSRHLKSLKDEGVIDTDGQTTDRKIFFKSKEVSIDRYQFNSIEISGSTATVSTTFDLDMIPSKYHEVFTTDWQTGSKSTLDIKDRLRIHNLFLEYYRVG